MSCCSSHLMCSPCHICSSHLMCSPCHVCSSHLMCNPCRVCSSHLMCSPRHVCRSHLMCSPCHVCSSHPMCSPCHCHCQIPHAEWFINRFLTVLEAGILKSKGQEHVWRELSGLLIDGTISCVLALWKG